jgi:cytoskeletal protein CcmA (bactofilin family)
VNANTEFEGGSVASLGLNVKVEMEGKVNASGVLVAQSVEIKSTGSIRIEGDVEQIDVARQQLTVLGVTVAVRAGADLKDESNANRQPLTFADIAVGDRVQARAFLDGTTVVASELERDDPRADARLRGRVTAVNAGSSQIGILGVTVTGDAATEYHGASGQAAFFNSVRVGDFITADWNNFTTTGAPADQLSVEDD